MFETAVTRYGNRSAINFLGRRWLFRELGEAVERAARGLQDLGVTKGVRVGLCLPNTPYSVILFFATLRAGGTVVNFNPLYVERELRHQVEDSGTSIMAVPDLHAICGKVEAIARDTGLRKIIVCPIGAAMPPAKRLLFSVLKRRDVVPVRNSGLHVSYARLTARPVAPDPVTVAPATDVAVLQYTGGTTGTPKGAMLTHANLTANVWQMTQVLPSIRRGEERMLGVLPLFHVFAMTVVLNLAIETGAEMLLLPRFELKQLLRTIERQKPTLFPAVPTIYTAINMAAAKARLDLRSIRLCISGGAPLPVDVRHRFQTLTGCKLVEGYGLSEASPVVSCNPIEGVAKDGSIGIPVPGTVVELRDPLDPSRLVAPGQPGELCVRGPQVMRGYWNKPDDTADVFTEGALRTGDIARIDEDGYIFILDRIKDVILCGGYNVYPRNVEEALYQHGAIAEAMVVGVPDAYRGQAPKAFVTLRDGHATTPEELKAFLGDYLSRIELPREVVIRRSLPKTLVGKLSKKDLLAEEEAASVHAGAEAAERRI
ncbi:MAG: long-chain fatty acid--CoA ligase, partial [Acetobacteraceae bacterium]|nr:long-chain fatty acid--CoA ligase [Acetobacteraceae bacterium]